MEIIRMLVRSAKDETWARQAFLTYAHKGELHKLAALFLAVPELFLSPPQSELSSLHKLDLDLELNSWENKTFIKKQLPLLLDLFTLVGHKLSAYIRLEEYVVKSLTDENYAQSRLEIDYFLHEVADKKKPGVTSRDDHYLSFFEVGPLESNDDDDDDDARPFWIKDDDKYRGWDYCTSKVAGTNVFFLLPYLLNREDFKRDAIYRLIPRVEKQDAVLLSSAIEKKLSSVSASHGCPEASVDYATQGAQSGYPG